jgi:hypothetical protein
MEAPVHPSTTTRHHQHHRQPYSKKCMVVQESGKQYKYYKVVMKCPRDRSNQYKKWKATSCNKTESYSLGWMRYHYLKTSVTAHYSHVER